VDPIWRTVEEEEDVEVLQKKKHFEFRRSEKFREREREAN